MRKAQITIALLCATFLSYAQFRNYARVRSNYYESYEVLTKALAGSNNLSFKDAVFLVESTYYDHQLDTAKLNAAIRNLARICKAFKDANKLNYDLKDESTVSAWAAIFKVLTDTIQIIQPSGEVSPHFPYTYDFEDFFGENEWSNMFVTKLIGTRSGNCHSLPYLYKILAEELGTTAHLALAPNHIYIKHKSLKTGMFNTELTSGTFPIDAWIMASGYIHLTAIQNSVYMKALNDKESIALCLIDLAEGYKRKTNDFGSDFIIKCCDRAIEYFPNYVNALMLKAETIKFQHDRLKAENPNPTNDVKTQTLRLFNDMQDLYVKVHKLGYRQMPKDMYMKWLVELKTQKEKYQNKNVTSYDK